MIEPSIKKIEINEKSEIPKKKKGKKIFIFFLLVIIVAGGFLILKPKYFFPESAIKENLNLIKEGKLEKAYSLTSFGFKEKTSSEIFRKFISQHPGLERYKSISFYKKSKEDNVLIFEGVVLTNEEKTIKIKYKVIKEENIWKVHGIEILKEED